MSSNLFPILEGDFLNTINPFSIMQIFVLDCIIFLTRSLMRAPGRLRDNKSPKEFIDCCIYEVFEII